MSITKLKQAKQHLHSHPISPGKLVPFIGPAQRLTMRAVLYGEEGDWMADKILALVKQIDEAPVTYQQDGLGMNAIVHFHYFGGGVDVWITELDMEDKVTQAFGYTRFAWAPQDAELGYISITELIRAGGLELDLHWTPKTLAETLKC
jgi:hypothetical protein